MPVKVGNIRGPQGIQGPQGAPGSAFSTVTTAAFTAAAAPTSQPLRLTTTSGLSPGVILYINPVGYYNIVSVDSPTQASVVNAQVPGNAAAGTIAILKLVDMVFGLRVSQEEETIGLDLTQHGELAYAHEAGPDFSLELTAAVEQQADAMSRSPILSEAGD